MTLRRAVTSFVFGSFLAACSNGTQTGDAAWDTGTRADVVTVDTSTRDIVTATDASADVATITDAPTTDAPASDTPMPMDVAATDVVATDGASSDVGVLDVITRDVAMTRACGGLGGARCGRNEFCSYALADMCGAADQTGMCQPVPSSCTPTTMPVCGCDGMTYPSECEANMAGTSVAATGACASTGDCRTTSCPRGQYCSPCRGVGGMVYVCLPTGTAC